jgi:hypothetical protein
MWTEGQIIEVRAAWERPPWCREDWVLVSPIASGRRHYARVKDVEMGDGLECWIPAMVTTTTEGRHGISVRFLGYGGEASVDAVFARHVRLATDAVLAKEFVRQVTEHMR